VSSHLVLVENAKDWPSEIADVQLVTAKEYLSQPERYKARDMRVINLCRSYRYLSTGYYCSLLAEARRHKVIPSVRTITDLSSKAIYSLNVEDLDELVQRVLRKRAAHALEERFEVNVFFGQSEDPELQEIGRQLFDIFRAPLLRIEFRRQQHWQIEQIRAMHINTLKPEQHDFFVRSYNAYVSSRWRKPKERAPSSYDIAILYNPEEKLPPSDKAALRKFVSVGKRMGIDVELITRKDYGRLAEYDGLLIRETTAINHHTYRFAKKAETEGMVVIDDPDSIVKCTNKVYLAELLAIHRIPTPRTVILRKGEKYDLGKAVGYPAVIKIPDGSFSRGVFKVNNAREADEAVMQLFKETDLVLAQEYFYTEFDWRIGILNNEPLFACQYFMSPKHWQIIKHEAGGKTVEGAYKTWAVEEAPAAVIETARAAAKLIGNGLYGVDIKERDGRVVVIEVNDNPNIEAGVEDAALGNELYRRILGEFQNRMAQRRRG
jgi:glutathione synthase/RimK-type ligase-like ATP-grasp enzyme